MSRFELPDWIPLELYGDLLAVCNFFYTFSEVLIQRSFVLISFSKIAIAVLSKGFDNLFLVEIFQTLLEAKAECADLEDGNEGKFIFKEED